MDKKDMTVEQLGYAYACLLSEINTLYKEKKEYEQEFIKRKNTSTEKKNIGRMQP